MADAHRLTRADRPGQVRPGTVVDAIFGVVLLADAHDERAVEAIDGHELGLNRQARRHLQTLEEGERVRLLNRAELRRDRHLVDDARAAGPAHAARPALAAEVQARAVRREG